jgi:hypothetical protein
MIAMGGVFCSEVVTTLLSTDKPRSTQQEIYGAWENSGVGVDSAHASTARTKRIKARYFFMGHSYLQGVQDFGENVAVVNSND